MIELIFVTIAAINGDFDLSYERSELVFDTHQECIQYTIQELEFGKDALCLADSDIQAMILEDASSDDSYHVITFPVDMMTADSISATMIGGEYEGFNSCLQGMIDYGVQDGRVPFCVTNAQMNSILN